MDPALQMVVFTVERFEFRGLRPDPGQRFPEAELGPKLVGGLLHWLYPRLRDPGSDGLLTNLGEFSLDIGFRRRDGKITIEGAIEHRQTGEWFLAFRIVVHSSLPEQVPTTVLLDYVDGRGHFGSEEQITLLATSEVRIATKQRMEHLHDRLETLLGRLEGSDPRTRN